MSTVQPSAERKIPFTCPYCGHHTETAAKFAGRSGPCVSCSNVITVPTLESLIAPKANVHQRRRSTQQAKPIWLKVGMGLGAVLSLGVICVVVWAMLQPAFAAARSAAKCSACESNLRDIGSALEQHYADKGCYPPAVAFDEKGKPMHSWRVLLLPYLGPEAKLVFDQYKMDEPWNSKDNSLLLDMMPPVYLCPADEGALPGETSYLAIVGPQTLINSSRPVKRTTSYDGPVLRDNPSETMVVLEAADSGVNWMRPKDISMSALPAGLDSGNAGGPCSEHLQGVNILMADQSIIRLKAESVEVDDLRGMATIDGGNEYIEVLEELDY